MHIFSKSAPPSITRASRSTRLLLMGLPLLAVSLAGCGGGSSQNSSNSAEVRDFNAIPDSGVASVTVGGSLLPGSTLNVNGSVVSGQSFLSASSYTYITAAALSASFTLSAFSSTTYPSSAQTLTTGTYYTEILFGRGDVATTDPRYPTLRVVADDRTSPASGDARLRIVQAAPDLGNVDVLVGGQVVASNVGYQSIGSYLNVTAGNQTVQVNRAGTSTVLVAAQTVTLSTGQLYSLFVVEPTLTPSPGYNIQLQSDAS